MFAISCTKGASFHEILFASLEDVARPTGVYPFSKEFVPAFPFELAVTEKGGNKRKIEEMFPLEVCPFTAMLVIVFKQWLIY